MREYEPLRRNIGQGTPDPAGYHRGSLHRDAVLVVVP